VLDPLRLDHARRGEFSGDGLTCRAIIGQSPRRARGGGEEVQISKSIVPAARNRGFESISLQRRVSELQASSTSSTLSIAMPPQALGIRFAEIGDSVVVDAADFGPAARCRARDTRTDFGSAAGRIPHAVLFILGAWRRDRRRLCAHRRENQFARGPRTVARPASPSSQITRFSASTDSSLRDSPSSVQKISALCSPISGARLEIRQGELL
jgi:hypothetical protein